MAVAGPEGKSTMAFKLLLLLLLLAIWTAVDWLAEDRWPERRTPTEERSSPQDESYRGDCFILIGIGLGSLGPPAAERILGVLNNGRWIPQNQS